MTTIRLWQWGSSKKLFAKKKATGWNNDTASNSDDDDSYGIELDYE